MALTIEFGETEIIDYLRVEAGQDVAVIDTVKKSAMDEAEEYLNHDFSSSVKNPDGTTTTTANPAPTSVKVWVLNRIVQVYENRGTSITPDFSSLSKYRKINFGGFKNLNAISETPETDAVNGLT